MGVLAWIIVGGLAGWLAAHVVGERKPQGCLMHTVVGIVGAVIGGFIFGALGGVGVTGLNLWSIFVAFVGAALFLVLLRGLSKG